ncbi:MAG: LUD domain-containing protein [Thermodesulfobacteriota bacterium]
MIQARTEILTRIKSALADDRAFDRTEAGPGLPWPEPEFTREELKAEFARRWALVGGFFHQTGSEDELEAVLARIMAGIRNVCLGESALKTVPGLENLLRRSGIEARPGRPGEAAEAEAGLTGVCLALAYSGTLLVTSREPGDLTASLLPPLHVALIPVRNLVYGLKEVLHYLNRDGWPRAAVLITGPSRTADIELNLVQGVHGPKFVHAVLLDYQT